MTTNSIKEHLAKIKFEDAAKHKIVEKIRLLVKELFPKVKEKIMYGGIIFTQEEAFGGVFTYTNHVSMEFSYGYKLKDPKKLLEGKGKYRKHLKFQTIKNINEQELRTFLSQIKVLEKS